MTRQAQGNHYSSNSFSLPTNMSDRPPPYQPLKNDPPSQSQEDYPSQQKEGYLAQSRESYPSHHPAQYTATATANVRMIMQTAYYTSLCVCRVCVCVRATVCVCCVCSSDSPPAHLVLYRCLWSHRGLF